MRLRGERYDAALPAIRAQFSACPEWWCEDYAMARTTLQALAQALLSGGVMQGERTRTELLKDYRAQQRVVLELLREAGMTPASAARLFRDQATGAAAAVDVGAIVAAGRQAAGS